MATEPTPKPLPELGLSDALVMMDEEKSELDKVLELMHNPKHVQHYTELNKNEILAFSILGTIGKRHPLLLLTDWLSENLQLRVSKGRKGREETVKLASRGLSGAWTETTMNAPRRGLGRWFGRR